MTSCRLTPLIPVLAVASVLLAPAAAAQSAAALAQPATACAVPGLTWSGPILRPPLSVEPGPIRQNWFRVTPTGQQQAGQPSKTKEKKSQEKKPPKGDAKPKQEPAFSFVFKDRPSFRFGRVLRMDVRLLVQGDARQSGLDQSDAGFSLALTRRRLGIEGTFLRHFEYQVEKELDAAGIWRDVFINFRPVPYAQAQVGKFKVPFGLEELISPRDRDFPYRALVVTELAPQRARGAMAHGRVLGGRARYQIGVFEGDGENSPRIVDPPYPLVAESGSASGRSVAARVRVAPFAGRKGKSSLETLEVGAAVMPSTVAAGMNHFRGRTVLDETFFPRTFYVNGRRLRLGTELNWTPGPFSVRAEYMRAEEERLGMGVGDETGLDSNLPPLVTDGWYAAATWVLTGEKKGGGVTPRRPLLQGGAGAFELALRYDTIRFGAGDRSAAPTSSPRAADIAAAGDRVLTFGLNWYVNAWVKIQVNAIRERLEGSRAWLGGAAGFWSSVLRFQFSM